MKEKNIDATNMDVDQLVSATTHNIIAAISELADGNHAKALHIAVAAGSAVLQVITQMVGRENADDDGTDIENGKLEKRTNNESLMFAVQLLGAAIHNSGDKVSVKASPLILYHALINAEKILGHEPDDFLDKSMVKVARNAGATPGIEVIEQAAFEGTNVTRH